MGDEPAQVIVDFDWNAMPTVPVQDGTIAFVPSRMDYIPVACSTGMVGVTVPESFVYDLIARIRSECTGDMLVAADIMESHADKMRELIAEQIDDLVRL